MQHIGSVYKVILSLVFLVILVACQHNTAPVAVAGKSITLNLGETVYLNGSDSYDYDEDVLTFHWSFTILPDGSSPYLDSPESPFASFVPDMPGAYILELQVFDGETFSSKDHVVVKVQLSGDLASSPPTPSTPPVGRPPPPTLVPSPPLYVALVNEEIRIFSTAELIDNLTVEWELLYQPDNSSVVFTAVEDNDTLFFSDMVGIYTIQQIVVINEKRVNTDIFDVQVVESRVTAGDDRRVFIDEQVSLSYGYFAPLPPNDAIADWVMLEKPSESLSEIERINDYSANFIPDVNGEYIVQVTVITGEGVSSEDIVIYTATDQSRNQFDHTGIFNECSNCHNGLSAMAKSVSHISSSEQCDSCHSTQLWVPVITVDHSEVIGTCINCHNSAVALGKNVSHIASSDVCEACHSTFNFMSIIVVDHSSVVGACSDCHNGLVAIGKNPAHITSSDACDTCHSTMIFTPVIRVDHNSIIGACLDCHNGTVAIGKPLFHIESSEVCSDCHNEITWKILGESKQVDLPAGLEISLDSNASIFTTGELVKATATFTNNSDKDIELYQLPDNLSPLVIEVSGAELNSFGLSNPNDLREAESQSFVIVLKQGESIKREVIWDQKLPSSDIAMSGFYVVEAYVLLLDSDSIVRRRIGVKAEIMLEIPANTISANSALTNAIEEPSVKVWYENNAKLATCRVDNQIVQVVDYQLVPIETLVPVLDSETDCHTALSFSTLLSWEIYFHSANKDNPFVYRVTIDAISGKVLRGVVLAL